MTRLFLRPIDRLIVCVVTAALLSAAPAAAQKADPAHYGALPNVSEAQISPDGRYLALLQTINATSAVVFYDLDDPEATPTGVGVGAANARGIIWANNDKVLLQISQSSTVSTVSGLKVMEFFRWVSVSKEAQKASVLFGNEPGYYLSEAGTFYTVMADDPERGVFSRTMRLRGANRPNSRLNRGDVFVSKLFSVNLKNGRIRILETGNENTDAWLVNNDGSAAARIDYDQSERMKRVYMPQEGGSALRMRFEVNTANQENAGLTFLGLSQKPGIAFTSAFTANGRSALAEFDLNSGKRGDIVFSHPTYDINEVIYTSGQSEVSGVTYVDHMPRIYHLDPDNRAMQDQLQKAMPDASIRVISKSGDGRRAIVEALYSDHPKQFYVYDRENRALNMIASSYPQLDGKAVAEKKSYDYIASDGVSIPGYLTAPVNAQKQNMPLIVLPHGGPAARDDQSFDWWSFFYAARGYLVYQPNFRGSSGYGAGFQQAGDGEWGRRMQDDISEGVQKLIADGMADPERVCIVGSSYGGYAALAGATLTPDLYKCAVSVNGISNLLQLLSDGASEGMGNYWSNRIGSRFNDEDSLRSVSPMYAITPATPPVMLIHSEEDVIVPIGQSRRMRNALEENRIPHEFVTLKDEDHWLSNSAMRTKMLEESIRFIDQHIGG